MSIESTLGRVTAIRQALVDPRILIGGNSALTGGTEAPATSGISPGSGTSSTNGTTAAGGESSFAAALAQASGGYQASAVTPPGTLTDPGVAGAGPPGYSYSSQSLDGVAGSSPISTADGPGGRIVAIAETQLGQSEQPPGSNESPAIAQYREATSGAIPGEPWCAYFASWVGREAGVPLGQDGQGLGAVSDIWSWAQSTGRAIPNGPGVQPKPGDLIVFGDQHVGIVRAVLPSGQIETIEGNYENKVAANVRSPGEATGYVSMS